MSRTRPLLLACLLSAASASADQQSIDIHTAHHSSSELATEAQLKQILSEYDLQPWTFTREVVIDEHAIPHSHPVLTLHTRHLNHHDDLLSAYLHEQLHWFLTAHDSATQAAIQDLMEKYPAVPVGFPEGAQDRDSTYVHLLVCRLEQNADSKLLGSARAEAVIGAQDHYTWIYKTVVKDGPQIDAVLKRYHLELPSH